MKKNTLIYDLSINLTLTYISFKIEKGKYLGVLPKKKRANDTHIHIVEHCDDRVDYLAEKDIFDTENEAVKSLIEILKNKIAE